MKLMMTTIRQITRLLAMVIVTEIATTTVAVKTETILMLVLVTALTMERAMVMEVVTLMVVMMVTIRPPMVEAMAKVIPKARHLKRQEASWALS